MRATKIVCTIGPASQSFSMLKQLAEAGMNVARLNLSHGTQDDCKKIINSIRKLNKEGNYCIAIMFDTKGAEIRTGVVPHPISIEKGQEVIFSPYPLPQEKQTVILVNYDRFFADVPETDRIIIDNGKMVFDILSANKDGTVRARAQDAGSIGSRRNVNLPGADIDLPSVTEKDWEDIAFAVTQQVDYIALSFIRTAEEVQHVRTFLQQKDPDIHIITKIETHQAIENLFEIIEVSDGIMVARGDLGANLPFEDLPVIQDEIVQRCRNKGIPVIVATHMLESMIEHPMPTRAEVTDVAYAVLTGADATMLSGETAAGMYPVKAVEAMARIQERTQQHLSRFPPNKDVPVHGERDAHAEAAVTLASSADSSALLVFTRVGRTACEVSRFRPQMPIIALTNSQRTLQRLQLVYGIHPLLIEFENDPESTVQTGLDAAKRSGIVKAGDSVTLLSDTQAKTAPVTSVQVRTVT